MNIGEITFGGGVTFTTGGDCCAGVPGARPSRELAVLDGSSDVAKGAARTVS